MPGDRAGFRRYWTTLRERWWLVLLCTVVTLVAAAIYVAVAPRTYTGEAELLVNAAPPENTILFDLPVLHQSGDPTQDVLTGANLVTTPQVAELPVIANLHLRTTTSDLLKNVSATPVGQSNIVAVQAQASSPHQAERIARRVHEPDDRRPFGRDARRRGAGDSVADRPGRGSSARRAQRPWFARR